MMDIEFEIKCELVSSSRKYNGVVPCNVTSYLDASMDIGVWVAGYHWVRAVSHLYKVSIVVVIHGWQHAHAFGDVSHPRLYLYKRDVETHYDALPPRISSESHDDVASTTQMLNLMMHPYHRHCTLSAPFIWNPRSLMSSALMRLKRTRLSSTLSRLLVGVLGPVSKYFVT